MSVGVGASISYYRDTALYVFLGRVEVTTAEIMAGVRVTK
jgi:hypothetical protein